MEAAGSSSAVKRSRIPVPISGKTPSKPAHLPASVSTGKRHPLQERNHSSVSAPPGKTPSKSKNAPISTASIKRNPPRYKSSSSSVATPVPVADKKVAHVSSRSADSQSEVSRTQASVDFKTDENALQSILDGRGVALGTDTNGPRLTLAGKLTLTASDLGITDEELTWLKRSSIFFGAVGPKEKAVEKPSKRLRELRQQLHKQINKTEQVYRPSTIGVTSTGYSSHLSSTAKTPRKTVERRATTTTPRHPVAKTPAAVRTVDRKTPKKARGDEAPSSAEWLLHRPARTPATARNKAIESSKKASQWPVSSAYALQNDPHLASPVMCYPNDSSSVYGTLPERHLAPEVTPFITRTNAVGRNPAMPIYLSYDTATENSCDRENAPYQLSNMTPATRFDPHTPFSYSTQSRPSALQHTNSSLPRTILSHLQGQPAYQTQHRQTFSSQQPPLEQHYPSKSISSYLLQANPPSTGLCEQSQFPARTTVGPAGDTAGHPTSATQLQAVFSSMTLSNHSLSVSSSNPQPFQYMTRNSAVDHEGRSQRTTCPSYMRPERQMQPLSHCVQPHDSIRLHSSHRAIIPPGPTCIGVTGKTAINRSGSPEQFVPIPSQHGPLTETQTAPERLFTVPYPAASALISTASHGQHFSAPAANPISGGDERSLEEVRLKLSVSPSLLPSSSPRFRDDPELTRVLSIHQAVSALASTNASNYGLASRQIDRSLSNPLLLQLNNQFTPIPQDLSPLTTPTES